MASSETEITVSKIMFMQSDTDLMPHLFGVKKVNTRMKGNKIWSSPFSSISLVSLLLPFEVIRKIFFPFLKFIRFFTERKMNFFLCRIVFANLFGILQTRSFSSVKGLNIYTKKGPQMTTLENNVWIVAKVLKYQNSEVFEKLSIFLFETFE